MQIFRCVIYIEVALHIKTDIELILVMSSDLGQEFISDRGRLFGQPGIPEEQKVAPDSIQRGIRDQQAQEINSGLLNAGSVGFDDPFLQSVVSRGVSRAVDRAASVRRRIDRLRLEPGLRDRVLFGISNNLSQESQDQLIGDLERVRLPAEVQREVFAAIRHQDVRGIESVFRDIDIPQGVRDAIQFAQNVGVMPDISFDDIRGVVGALPSHLQGTIENALQKVGGEGNLDINTARQFLMDFLRGSTPTRIARATQTETAGVLENVEAEQQVEANEHKHDPDFSTLDAATREDLSDIDANNDGEIDPTEISRSLAGGSDPSDRNPNVVRGLHPILARLRQDPEFLSRRRVIKREKIISGTASRPRSQVKLMQQGVAGADADLNIFNTAFS